MNTPEPRDHPEYPPLQGGSEDFLNYDPISVADSKARVAVLFPVAEEIKTLLLEAGFPVDHFDPMSRDAQSGVCLAVDPGMGISVLWRLPAELSSRFKDAVCGTAADPGVIVHSDTVRSAMSGALAEILRANGYPLVVGENDLEPYEIYVQGARLP
ncbi:hypothetical protein [Actinokineospora pegani]|uniref:hypothetical protein n=1 Tax=Actinokineospora pegani TaxID=2654637 RepID=UPI0012E9CE14|nr:hypothetical protein [Actinokineospora pegani]